VISKLFARVIKAEDATKTPWQSVDMFAILLSLNGHFTACERQEEDVGLGLSDGESVESCFKMAQTLVESIVQSPDVGPAIRQNMAGAGIDLTSSPLWFVVKNYIPVEISETHPQTPAKGVAVLVSALGSAQSEIERSQALDDLRDYIKSHGDQDLNAHLEQISPAFRNFILDQLAGSHGESETPEKDENESMGNNTMAERLRNLRERLSEKNVGASESPQSQGSGLVPPSSSLGYSSDFSTATAPSVTVKTVATTSSQSLRERLEAAQATRKSSLVAPETTSTSGSRAAALRARLQAVKQQAQQSSDK
jgi:hypothetical protein